MDVHSWILRRGESFLQIARYLFSNLHVLVIGESQIGPFIVRVEWKKVI